MYNEGYIMSAQNDKILLSNVTKILKCVLYISFCLCCSGNFDKHYTSKSVGIIYSALVRPPKFPHVFRSLKNKMKWQMILLLVHFPILDTLERQAKRVSDSQFSPNPGFDSFLTHKNIPSLTHSCNDCTWNGSHIPLSLIIHSQVFVHWSELPLLSDVA